MTARDSYDRVAAAYAEKYFGELAPGPGRDPTIARDAEG